MQEKERLASRQVEYKRLYVGNYHATRFGQVGHTRVFAGGTVYHVPRLE